MRARRYSRKIGLAAMAWLLAIPFAGAAPLTDYGAITAAEDSVQRPGAVVWLDLLTDDVAAAVRFYQGVFGWDIETSADGEYAYAELNGKPIASIVAYDKTLGETDGLWIPSLSVPDVGQAMEAVKKAGGTIVEPPEDLTGRGRYLLVEDPTGAAVMLLRATGGDPDPEEQVNGRFWNELWTDDPEAASAFYEAVIGYRTVALNDATGNRHDVMGRDGRPMVSVIRTPLPNVEPNWLTYLLVDDVAAATQKVLGAGGAVLVPPLKDGFNEDVAIVADPTGGVLALQQKSGGK